MVGIILASHGEFASGILQSASMIFGEQENVAAVTLMPSEGPEDIKKKMQDAVQSFDNQDEVLFLVDLWGGTPFNQANSLFEEHKENWAIVAGMNLPMVIEAYASRFSMESAQEIATHILGTAKEGVKVKPEELEPEEEQGAVVEQSAGAGKPGKLSYVLARIDTRLLHGQVATAWTKTTGPTRIIVVSDAVAKDELRKKLIQQAAPPGVKAHVVPIEQMIKISKDDQHFGGQKALLLFETPQDVLRAVEGGVPLETVNVGSMAHSPGKVQPNKVLAFGQDDIDTFNKLKEAGVKFDVRKVPSDSKGNMEEIIKKAQEEINKK
ncbi:mannose/fructose/sorbose PTS transporter subunit IIA [Vagococcus carniphilus]|uniref:PTS system mannose-specific EIIAB component n=1 Tax=Vagococcus carniphilus TaxID=218144 RepID=A0AAW8U5R9_9ENTE|nr:mannose/fructose/sorbose PTS transporter subunit IIA [Vagococcus carniphilus]MDT2815807.1 mannose/fructose/sorbose PTS transporter subunit IIA [Vagococcus carniphilus]MDT2834888.1 mannose/fructose/sorbose PTS transporter subunit IIA [Vagococcus carniphilus]MDT2849271.1 mannose/fructose/sorbose PTS transporter subunit IIA [Vagococcus carniphilus]MDT2866198.1 mannose/fructose/sorbose PTS transporter subunit IIA [Vagococcus carniphilus]